MRRPLLIIGVAVLLCTIAVRTQQPAATEAPTGFAGLTNGFVSQAEMDAAREAFIEQEGPDDGLGPVYNAQSCGECHQNPVTGGTSQILELRAGREDDHGRFVDHPGGSLIHSRAIDASLQEHILPGHPIRSLRSSLNVLGDGFVEAIADETLEAIAGSQPAASYGFIHGLVIRVPVGEAPGVTRVGRFGHKNQHASLLSFSADAYVNEMGITSDLQPTENTSNGRDVADFDDVADPENQEDVPLFAAFMRSTMAPPRDADLAATPEAIRGAEVFAQIGCATCHVPSIQTAPVGTSINGGTMVVNEALGDKVIHPYGDFLLHDIGTGDGIVQNGGRRSADKIRTAPLWGLRTHSRYLHDGSALTLPQAIKQHDGEAWFASWLYQSWLAPADRQALLAFLGSL